MTLCGGCPLEGAAWENGMPETPTVPTDYPWWMHHPTNPMVLTTTREEAQALVDADPLWRLFPYSDEEKAALAPPDPPPETDGGEETAQAKRPRR